MQIKYKLFTIFCFISTFILFFNLQIKAFWFEELKDRNDFYWRSFGFVFESGHRKISEKTGKEMINYSTNKTDGIMPGTNLKTQFWNIYRVIGLGKHCNTFIRLNVKTADFGHTRYNNYGGFGLGTGFKISFPEIKKGLHPGMALSWDYILGQQRNGDEMNWAETTFACWLSHRYRKYDIYYGISYISTKIFIKLDDYHLNWRLDNNIGGIFGLQYSVAPKLSMGIESHFINENTIGLNLKYLF